MLCRAALGVQVQVQTESSAPEPWRTLVAGNGLSEGSKFRLRVCVAQPSHLYVFRVAGAGALQGLLPAEGGSSEVGAGIQITALQELHGAAGNEAFLAIASRRSLSVEEAQAQAQVLQPTGVCARVRDPEPTRDPPKDRPDEYACLSDFPESGDHAVVRFAFTHQ